MLDSIVSLPTSPKFTEAPRQTQAWQAFALVMNYRFLFVRLFAEKGREWGRRRRAHAHTEERGDADGERERE